MSDLDEGSLRTYVIFMLQMWKTLHGSRDQVIREAYKAGVSKSDIYRYTRVARTTIDRILDGPEPNECCGGEVSDMHKSHYGATEENR